MKKIKLSLSFLIVAFALAACSQMPSSAFFNRGQPESLLSVSTEALVVDIPEKGSASQLISIINRKEPSSATVTCNKKSSCDKAAEVLNQFGIPYETKDGSGNKVSLNYENVTARDCDNRFITNHSNPYNLNHPSFGCSTAVNQVLMVGDKRQFTDPLLLGPYDGQKATQNFDDYLSRTPQNNSGNSGTGSNSANSGATGTTN